MNDKYELGKCHCCLKLRDVRWKNIYHMGSEGLWICDKCEKKVLEFIRGLVQTSYKKKLEECKKKKRNYENRRI